MLSDYQGAEAALGTLAPDGQAAKPARDPADASALRLVLRTFTENRAALAGLVIIVLVILFCYAGPLLYSTNQVNVNLALVNLRPSAAHLLGTDNNGYDVLGRLMAGGQVSIEVGLAVGVVSTVIGVLYGTIAGYFGKFLDAVMMRIIDVGLAIPAVFLFIFVSRVITPTVWLLILLLSGMSWLVPARLVRGDVLSLRVREYVQAARGLGGRPWQIIYRHLVPNSIGIIVVNGTFQIANAILMLAVLQFLGFSIPPPTPSWGTMLSNGINFLFDGYWWQVYPPLIAIVLLVLAFNLVGDGLRDAFEVRLQRR
jgi:peptide/nickel transport system permease protein